jgi:hypothetical protein
MKCLLINIYGAAFKPERSPASVARRAPVNAASPQALS